jgi:hypothetical protein
MKPKSNKSNAAPAKKGKPTTASALRDLPAKKDPRGGPGSGQAKEENYK